MNDMFKALDEDIQRVEASARTMGRYATCEDDRMVLAHVFMHLEDARRVLKGHVE